MSRICLLCNENETDQTPGIKRKVCDPCADNAVDILERNAEIYGAAEEMFEACSMVVDTWEKSGQLQNAAEKCRLVVRRIKTEQGA